MRCVNLRLTYLLISVTTVKVGNATAGNAGNAVSHLCALRSPISSHLIGPHHLSFGPPYTGSYSTFGLPF